MGRGCLLAVGVSLAIEGAFAWALHRAGMPWPLASLLTVMGAVACLFSMIGRDPWVP